MRCAPQVHGAARDAFAYARAALAIEANAATDNPMVFADAGRHRLRRQLPRRADRHRRGRARARRCSSWRRSRERRSDRLVNPALSGLAPFLTRDSGLHSGYMMAQVTAAALVSELKTLAHPASVDTIPTSANREDHVSMSMAAALKAERALAARARASSRSKCCSRARRSICWRRSQTSPALAPVHARVRSDVPTLADDRPPSPDIETISKLITSRIARTRVRHRSQVKIFSKPI